MYYPDCGMMHIKYPLLLIGKSSLCGGSGIPLSLFEWSFTICLTPYDVLSASLNKTLPSFLPFFLLLFSVSGFNTYVVIVLQVNELDHTIKETHSEMEKRMQRLDSQLQKYETEINERTKQVVHLSLAVKTTHHLPYCTD